MMIPTIVRPWESVSHRQPSRNIPPTPVNQSDRPSICVRPFQEEIGLHQEGLPKIRIRPLSDLADLDDQETPPLIRIRKFEEISEETFGEVSEDKFRRVSEEGPTTVLVRPARPRNPFPRRISQSDLPQDLSMKKANTVPGQVGSRGLKKAMKTSKEIAREEYGDRVGSHGGHVSKELLRSKLFKAAIIPTRSYQISIPEGANIRQVTTKTEKSSHIFQKTPVIQKLMMTRDESKNLSPPNFPTYPKKYSANIGVFYECPKCLEKYVSSIDVWEHSSRCQEEFNPIMIPQVELVDLDEEEDYHHHEVIRSPDVIPTTVLQSPPKPQPTGGNSDLKKFQCDFPGCKRTFTSTSGLSGHRRLHRASKNIFKCPKCTSQYSWKAQLRSHLIKRHPTVSSASSDLDKYAMNGKFPAASNTIINNNPEPEKNVRKGNNNKKGKTEAELIHFCSTCNLKFSSEYEFAAHDMQHRIDIEKNFNCRHCSKSFFRRIFLVEHEKSHF